MPPRRPSAALVPALLVVLTALVGLVTNAASSDARWPGVLDVLRGNPWTALAIGVLLVVTVTWRSHREIPVDPDSPLRNAERLANGVRAELDALLGGWTLDKPINVPLSRDPADQSGLPVRGLEELADQLGAAPRLVVVGEPGSGKSTALLVLARALLIRWTVEAPIPVVVNLSTWDPRSQRLDDLIRARIAGESKPAGRVRRWTRRLLRRSRASAPLDLVDNRRVLPVLDGLDELPRDSWADARRALAVALAAPDRRFVLACAAGSYPRIVPDEVMQLGGTRVVRLRPIRPAGAKKYLQPRTSTRRWDPVVAALRSGPPSPVAEALSTPLMLYLARVAYEDPATQPADLCEFPTTEAIQAHLLERYVPALYRVPRQPDAVGSAPAKGYNADQAQRWLSALARLLDRGQSPSLRWWRLSKIGTAEPRCLASSLSWRKAALNLGTMAAASPVALVALAGLGAGSLWLARWYVHLMGWALPSDDELGPWIDAIDPVSDAQVLLSPSGLLLASAVTLLGTAWLTLESEPSVAMSAPSARAAVAADRKLALVRGAVFAVVLMPVTWLLGVRAWRWFVAELAPRVVGTKAVSAEQVASWQAIDGITVTVGAGLVAAFITSLIIIAAIADSAWVSFRLNAARLAVTGQAPWGLLTFLDDAHRRGVLRRYGSVYGFRHRSVRRYLAHPAQAAMTDAEVIVAALGPDTSQRPARRFRKVRRELTAAVMHVPQASVELARLHENQAARHRHPLRLPLHVEYLHVAIDWWENAIKEGHPDSVLGLSELYERHLATEPPTLVRRLIRWNLAPRAREFWNRELQNAVGDTRVALEEALARHGGVER
jgi:hypothetical protein